MKKLINFSGGRGYYVDDVQALQEQLDLLKDNRYKDYGDFILSGCSVTADSIAPGLVYINDKTMYFAGANSLTFPVYMVEGVDQDLGVRNYDIEGVDKAAFRLKTAAIVSSFPGAGGYITITGAGGKTIFDIIDIRLGVSSLASALATTNSALSSLATEVSTKASQAGLNATNTEVALKAYKTQSSYIAFDLLNGATTGGTGVAYASFLLDTIGFVHLRGAINLANPSGPGELVFAVLPVECRPAEDVYYWGTPYGDTAFIRVQPNGNVSLFCIGTGVNSMDLDGCAPFLAGG